MKPVTVSFIFTEHFLNETLVKFTVLVAALLAGCASPSEVLKDGVEAKFKSEKVDVRVGHKALSVEIRDGEKCLAIYIDRNADDYARGSLRSKVVNSGIEPIEVLIRNGNFIYGVVQVTTTAEGSAARFRFGGIAILPQASLEAMTKSCE